MAIADEIRIETYNPQLIGEPAPTATTVIGDTYTTSTAPSTTSYPNAVTQPVSNPNPPTNNPADLVTDPTAFVNELRGLFPWLDQIGLSTEFFHELAATSASPDEVVVKLRATPQYRQRFPALHRADGSLRMNEAQYLATEGVYRQLLRQYGYPEEQYRTPQSLVGFFEGEIDGNELRQRLDIYRQLQDGSQDLKDAMYVYGGMSVTDDDLFEAIVDPAAGQRLTETYNANVAAQQFDYEGFISRATSAGLSRVAQELTSMERNGAVTGQVVQRILSVDPGFARQIMDVLYTGGSSKVNQAQPFTLQELLSTFEEAALGAAATEVGLELPTLERIQELRAAGIERARAKTGFALYAKDGNLFNAAVQRATGSGFDQGQFEQAAFLEDPDQTRRLGQGLAYERSAGLTPGGFRFDQDRTGRIFQRGLRV